MTVNEPDLIWTEEFTVRSYEMDRNGKVKFQSIANYLIDAASNHALHLGVSDVQLLQKKLTWVLSRFHVQISKYPKWKETIKIQTWPSDKQSHFALRDFRILDSNNEIIGRATSSWMILDISKRKPVTLPDFMNGMFHPNEGRSIEDSFVKLPELQKFEYEKYFNVRLSDLDINRHVNFINYIEWAVETVPEEVWNNYQLKSMQVAFRAESRYGDRIHSQSTMQTNGDKKHFIHRLKKEDAHELTRLVTYWIPFDARNSA